jgi:hypothetical protein
MKKLKSKEENHFFLTKISPRKNEIKNNVKKIIFLLKDFSFHLLRDMDPKVYNVKDFIIRLNLSHLQTKQIPSFPSFRNLVLHKTLCEHQIKHDV